MIQIGWLQFLETISLPGRLGTNALRMMVGKKAQLEEQIDRRVWKLLNGSPQT